MSKFPEDTEMRTSEKFSRRIHELIEENECTTNKQFAELVGVSFPVIIRAANFGIIPTTKILIKIADSLDISLDYLLGLTDKDEYVCAVSPSTFYNRVEELAKENNETLGGLASKMAFPRTYFYVWKKKNRLPLIEYAMFIADHFKVSLDYLFGRTDYKN